MKHATPNAPELARLRALIAERALDGADTSTLESAVRVLVAVDMRFARAKPVAQPDLFAGLA